MMIGAGILFIGFVLGVMFTVFGIYMLETKDDEKSVPRWMRQH